jgi:hypothetical protein
VSRPVLCAFLALALTSACAAENTTSSNTGAPRKLTKSDELAHAERSPSASQVSGNPRKWAGHYVLLDCEITNVTLDGDETDDQSKAGESYIANAECGKGVNGVRLVTPQPDLDYSDPSAVNRAVERAQRQGQEYRREAEDVASIVLVGEKVKTLDGNQRVTIMGPVLGSNDNDDARIRVDYAQ